ncbi:MAG: hypothetical protein ACTSQJ_18775, partial [Promethearchaeota archaeon]
ILDYGVEGLFTDIFIQTLLEILNDTFENIPIIARPNLANYYLYENIDLIKINLQKALQILSIDCCTETSVSIVGKKILNTSNSKNVLLNEIEGTSYLFLKNFEKVEKISTILAKPVRSYVSVGSVIMSVLGLTFASKCPVQDAVKLALYAASLSATLPPVEFFNAIKLQNYISTYLKK